MRTQVCTRHDEDVVVYHSSASSPVCPLCEAERMMADLNQDLGDVQAERDSLQFEIDRLNDLADEASEQD